MNKNTKANLLQKLRQHAFNIALAAFVLLMVFSAPAKSWVLRQLMLTGLFNAKIDSKNIADAVQVPIGFGYVNEQGIALNTSALRGKVIFINFWASWCPPCRAEFPSIQSLHAELKNNKAIEFVVINEDDNRAAGKAYLRQEQYKIPFYYTTGYVPPAIFSGTLPTTVVIDKKGYIKFRHEGFANYASPKFVAQLKALAAE